MQDEPAINWHAVALLLIFVAVMGVVYVAVRWFVEDTAYGIWIAGFAIVCALIVATIEELKFRRRLRREAPEGDE